VQSGKDAASASWLCPGRACMCEIRRVFLSYGDVSEVKVLVKLYYVDSHHIEASIRASECSK
jgi:hypothetical protein